MNSQSKHLTCRLFGSAFCIVALSTATARGEGSITFNGDDSVINNTTDDILDGSRAITITVWAKATDFGENGYGALVEIKETATPNKGLVMSHGNGINLYHVYVTWSGA